MTYDSRHFSQKIFMFPESYNELRKELSTHWPNLWKGVQYYMAFDASRFMEVMDAALDLRVMLGQAVSMDMPTNDAEGKLIDQVCTRYLTELRKKRGHPNP